jgi:hypothetical protein
MRSNAEADMKALACGEDIDEWVYVVGQRKMWGMS